MKKQLKICIALMLLVANFLLCSCQKEKKPCEELLKSGLEYGIDGYAHNGYVFLKNADNSSVFFMSEKTKSIMYGEKFKNALDMTADFAIYVSASNRYEMAIFECYSKNDMDENGEVIFSIDPDTSKKIKPGAFYNFSMLVNSLHPNKMVEYRKLTENGKVIIEYGSQDLALPAPEEPPSQFAEIHSIRLERIDSNTKGEAVNGVITNMRLEAIEDEEA